MISQDGQTFSHGIHEQNINGILAFQFGLGDTIFMCYSKKQGLLKFQKNFKRGSKENYARFTLLVPEPPVDEFYCPCTILCGKGDSVELVDVSQQIEWEK